MGEPVTAAPTVDAMANPCEMKMNVVFAGTPDFGAAILSALIDAGPVAPRIAAVYTAPDRPAGRGHKLRAPAVKTMAAARQLPLRQPAALSDADAAELKTMAPDLLITAAYGLRLPRAVLAAPRLGCVNVHPSLLPRWRGAAPVARAVEAGDAESGVTLMLMNEGLDRGDVLVARAVPIGAEETAGELGARLAAVGGALLVDALPQLAQLLAARTAQDDARATYAAKVTDHEARIDWRAPAVAIARRVRAFNPAPGAWTEWRGARLKIHRARAAGGGGEAGAPGTVAVAEGDVLRIKGGDGAVDILTLQRSGGRVMGAAEFMRGAQPRPGQQLQ